MTKAQHLNVKQQALAAYGEGKTSASAHYRRSSLLTLAAWCFGAFLVFSGMVVYRFVVPDVGAYAKLLWPGAVLGALLLLWITAVLIWTVVRNVPAITVGSDAMVLSPLPGLRATVDWSNARAFEALSPGFPELRVFVRNTDAISEPLSRWLLSKVFPASMGVSCGGSSLDAGFGDCFGAAQLHAERLGIPGPLDKWLEREIETV